VAWGRAHGFRRAARDRNNGVRGTLAYGFAPDGRWMAYVSDEAGRDNVYVRSFPPDTDGSTEQVSRRDPRRQKSANSSQSPLLRSPRKASAKGASKAC